MDLRRIFHLIATCVLVACASTASAQSLADQDDPGAPEQEAPREVKEAQQSAWAPPTAGDDGFTWVRLATGEWVKGEIKDLRDGTLIFDSDELDEFSYDWDDVTAVISSHPHTLTTWNRESYTGFIIARRGNIRVLDGNGIELANVAPHDVSSMIEGAPSEWNFWTGLVSAGSTIRSGNSDQKDGNLLVKLNRRALVTRWDNTGNFSYAESGGSKNQESSRVTSRFDWFMSPNLFLTPIDYEYFRDPFQNLQQRHTPGVAIGYDRDLGPATWDLSIGSAWQYTRYVSVEAGESRESDEWVGRVTANLEWDITSDIEFDLNYAINSPFSQMDDYTSNMLGVLSLDVWWNLEFDFTLAWDRQNNPRADENGVRPEQDDFRLTTGIAWDF